MNTKLLSKYRSTIMGVTIFGLLLYHFCFNVDKAIFEPLNIFIPMSWPIVNLFIFVSGFGIYISLSKVSTTYAGFMGKRALRLLPSYFPVIIVYIIDKVLTEGMTVREIVANLTLTAYFNDYNHQFNWYTPVIFLFYIISPAIYYFLNKNGKRLRNLIILIIVAVVINIGCYDEVIYTSLARLPLYMYGMYLGAKHVDNKDDSENNKGWTVYAIVAVLIMIAAFVHSYCCTYELINEDLSYATENYVGILTAPGLAVTIIGICALVYKIPVLGKAIKWIVEKMGECSYEIYLIHLLILSIKPEWAYVYNVYRILLIVGSVVAAVLYRYIIIKFVGAITRRDNVKAVS